MKFSYLKIFLLWTEFSACFVCDLCSLWFICGRVSFPGVQLHWCWFTFVAVSWWYILMAHLTAGCDNRVLLGVRTIIWCCFCSGHCCGTCVRSMYCADVIADHSFGCWDHSYPSCEVRTWGTILTGWKSVGIKDSINDSGFEC